MSYRVAITISGIEVRLYQDTLEKIFRKHGELRNTRSLILETVSAPDVVLAGHDKELLAIRHYTATPLGVKDMIVVYREDKRLIITAFLTSNRSRLSRKRRTIWRRQSR